MYAAANRLLRGAKRAAQGKSNAACRLFHRLWSRSLRLCGGLYRWTYFITHHKKKSEALQNRQAAGNGLPKTGRALALY
jgi:hypothetical protein